KDHIINRFKQLQASPLTFKAPQNHLVNLLQTVRNQHKVDNLLAYYSTPLPATLLRSLRRIWDEYRHTGKLSNLLDSLTTFAEANPITSMTQPKPAEVEAVQKEDLKLVCWLALS
ncbi:hypothetical protein M1N05_02955, partial [Dehalococcoidales bacterium]|nr:hypothetical protein [Dehalococcoidales bacterium]